MYLEDQEKKVEFYTFGESGYERVKSEREYVEVSIQSIHEREYDYEPRSQSVAQRSYYLDPETGLVVHDVEKYEKWLDSLKRQE